MSFDWREFLSICAAPTAAAGNPEARLRTAVSRGYYGAFHLARLRLEAEGNNFGTGVEVHQKLVEHLKTSNDIGRKRLGEQIGRLRLYRNQADYHDQLDNPSLLHNVVCASLENLKKAHPDIFAPSKR